MIRQTGPIVVACDFSESADEAIRQAHAIALDEGAPLVVCHVIPRPIQMHALFTELNMRDLDNLIERQVGLGDKLAARVQELTGRGDDDIEIAMESGEPYVEIVRKAEDLHARLVVIGNRGATGLDRLLLGSVSEKVVRYAHAPVLVVRRPEGKKLVVAATDLSDPATPAVEAAARYAEKRDSKLTLLHVVDIEPSPAALALAPLGAAPPVPTKETVNAVRDAARSTLENLLARFRCQGEVQIEQGRAAEAIVEFATETECSLLVVGTRGRTGLGHLTLGSVAETVIRDAPCSVLAVRLAKEG